MKHQDDAEEFHAVLMDGAKIAIDSQDLEEVKTFLRKKLPKETAKGIKMETVAYIASQGQSRAQDNARNHAHNAFVAACPRTSPLNPSCIASNDARVKFAKTLFNSGGHRSAEVYHSAWLSACHSAVNEARSTATTCIDNIKTARPNVDASVLPQIPDVTTPRASSPADMDLDDLPEEEQFMTISLHTFSFVTMKAS